MVFAQQMVLGKNPYAMIKSAVLELNADNQGLLLPRITDTAAINSLNPPDGMVIYFVPTKRLLLRTSGFWSTLAPSSSSISVATGTTGTDANVNGSPVALGGTVTLNFPSSSASARGLLTSTDWSTFNNKVGTARTINTTAPLSGGGDLSADRTISMTQANSTTNGWLSSTDWNTFNNKGSGSVTSVGLSLPSIFSVSNSPVTTSGTLTAALASQTQNLVFAAPNGSAGSPLFRLLQKADLPSTVVHTDQANTYTAGMKQTFRGSTTSAGVSFGGSLTADPTTLAAGDLWYRSDAGKLRFFDGTTARYLATEGGSISGTQNYVAKFSSGGTTVGNSQIFDNGTNVGIGTDAPTATLHVKNGSTPLRVEGLPASSSNNLMVVDANGNVGITSAVQFTFYIKGSFTIDLPSISNNGNASVSLNVPGAEVGDNVLVTPSGELTNSNGTGLVTIGYSYVPSAGRVTIRFLNPTQTSTDVPAMTFYITVFR